MELHPLRIVEWIDSGVQEGQVESKHFPKPFIISSAGFVVEETDDYIVLARDDMGNEEFRGLIAIPKIALKKQEHDE